MKISSSKIGTFITLAGIALLVSLIGAFAYAAYGAFKSEGRPLVVTASDFRSPDTRWIATLETVDNGLGFGLGMLYDEVHLRRPGDNITSHGNESESVVFYVAAIGESGQPPRLMWEGPERLVITYDAARHMESGPGRRVGKLHGISIAYNVVPMR